MDGVAIGAVFVFDGRDVEVYRSLAPAEGGTEVYDIPDLVYLGDDGSVIAAEADGYKVRLKPTTEKRFDDLRSGLRSYLASPGVNLDPSMADNPHAAAQVLLERQWSLRPFRWFPWLDRRVNGSEPPRLEGT